MFNKIYKSLTSALLTVLAVATASTSALSQTVTLQLNDGNFIVEGKLIKYDKKVYVIHSSKLGRATFDASKFICISGACPVSGVNPFAFHGSESDFSIHGSSSIGTHLMPWIIRAYAQSKKLHTRESGSQDGKAFTFSLKNGNRKTITTIHMEKQGSQTAFPSLAKRKAVIGMSDRKISAKELSMLKSKGVSNILTEHEHVIGLDGVVVIASPKNTLKSLTQKQIAGIFAGKITSWSDVGGAKKPIKIYSPDRDSGTLDILRRLVLQPRGLELSPSITFIKNNTTLAKTVTADPLAIGITSLAHLEPGKALRIRTTCGLKSTPNAFNIQTGDYPLIRKLYLYTSGTIENQHAVGLLNFAKYNERMDSVLNVAGFVNKKITSVPFSAQKDRVFATMTAKDDNFDPALMRRVLHELSEARQLSYTARFKENSFELDDTSRLGLHRIIKYLKKRLDKESYLMVVGFSDSDGPFVKNTRVSLERAKVVRAMLLKRMKKSLDKNRVIARGYSELLPASCNTTENNRRINRRVEFWIAKPAKGQKLLQQDITDTPIKKSRRQSTNSVRTVETKEYILRKTNSRTSGSREKQPVMSREQNKKPAGKDDSKQLVPVMDTEDLSLDNRTGTIDLNNLFGSF